MAYAHQGIELKNIPGVAPNPSNVAPADLISEGTPSGNDTLPRPALLTALDPQELAPRGGQVRLQPERGVAPEPLRRDARNRDVPRSSVAPLEVPRPACPAELP